MNKTLVCFGFGPIAGGLFVYEAYRSGNFDRFIVAEVDAELVDAVGSSGGRYTVNIAHQEGIEPFTLEGVELLNPTEPGDRRKLLEAIAASDEWATCLPSVDFYDRGAASVSRLLAEAVQSRNHPLPTVIYAAENHNHAAEILARSLRDALGTERPEIQALNTVIGKMSGVIRSQDDMQRLHLAPVCPGLDRAILIEEFNRILISRIKHEGFQRGIEVFREKQDLLPFEEAKLYGHNAVHALIAYLADVRGLETIAQAGKDADIMACGRQAFLDESGKALIHRHSHLKDELFTPAGFQAYAEDLLERMVNPYLNDLVSRVGRDHRRKLGYDDRLFGTMRIALEAGVEPVCLARGAAAGIVSMVRRRDELTQAPQALPGSEADLNDQRVSQLLEQLWAGQADERAQELIDLTCSGLEWIKKRFPASVQNF